MLCSRQSNNSIKNYKKELQKSNFQDLISNYKECIIHERNAQILLIEIYKIFNNIAPPNIGSLFLSRENVHNIRNFQILSNSTKKRVGYGLETVSYRSSVLWANLPPEYKS